jgi:hypothetical protein
MGKVTGARRHAQKVPDAIAALGSASVCLACAGPLKSRHTSAVGSSKGNVANRSIVVLVHRGKSAPMPATVHPTAAHPSMEPLACRRAAQNWAKRRACTSVAVFWSTATRSPNATVSVGTTRFVPPTGVVPLPRRPGTNSAANSRTAAVASWTSIAKGMPSVSTAHVAPQRQISKTASMRRVVSTPPTVRGFSPNVSAPAPKVSARPEHDLSVKQFALVVRVPRRQCVDSMTTAAAERCNVTAVAPLLVTSAHEPSNVAPRTAQRLLPRVERTTMDVAARSSARGLVPRVKRAKRLQTPLSCVRPELPSQVGLTKKPSWPNSSPLAPRTIAVHLPGWRTISV